MKIKHPKKLILLSAIAFVAVFIPVILFYPTNNSSSFGGRDKFADFVKEVRKLTLVTYTVEGKVIDQHGNAINDASVSYIQVDKISFDGRGYTRGKVKTGSDGSFTVSGVGAEVTISAYQKGYLKLPDSEAKFSRIKEPAPYMQEAPFPKKPITLRLHKPEDVDSLVHFVRKTKLPVSPGAQYCLGIPSFQPVECENADIIITFLNKDTDDANSRPNTIQITYPGGGAVAKSMMLDDEYDYHPPKDGYQQVTAASLWSGRIPEFDQYLTIYFKTGKGIYGKMQIVRPNGNFVPEEFNLSFLSLIHI